MSQTKAMALSAFPRAQATAATLLGSGNLGNPPLLWNGSPAFIHFKHLGFM